MVSETNVKTEGAPYEVRHIREWKVTVIGSPETGFELLRGASERPYPLRGSTLKEAVNDAMLVGCRCMADFDQVFVPRCEVKEPQPGKVYFIGGQTGAVKIGFAVNPNLRVKDLQCGSPIPLSILAVVDGMPQVERDYHKRFAAFRMHGEWFERCPEIEAEIERLSNG